MTAFLASCWTLTPSWLAATFTRTITPVSSAQTFMALATQSKHLCMNLCHRELQYLQVFLKGHSDHKYVSFIAPLATRYIWMPDRVQRVYFGRTFQLVPIFESKWDVDLLVDVLKEHRGREHLRRIALIVYVCQ